MHGQQNIKIPLSVSQPCKQPVSVAMLQKITSVACNICKLRCPVSQSHKPLVKLLLCLPSSLDLGSSGGAITGLLDEMFVDMNKTYRSENTDAFLQCDSSTVTENHAT